MLRIALLGCGRIGQMHAELLSSRVGGVQIAKLYDAVPEVAGHLADRYDLDVAPSLDEALAGVDAVAICTSTDTHAELIIRAAGSGLATFCEKPISLDLPTVDATLAAVDQAGTYLQVGFNRRFDPAHEAVRAAVADGSLGTLCLVKITSRDRLPPPVAYLARSGGMFLDMTIHDFDMARFISGSDIVEVHAAVGAALVDPAIAEIGDVDTSVVVLRHATGCLTVIDNSRQAVYGYDQRVEALGTYGVAISETPPRHSAVIGDDQRIAGAVLPDSFIDRYETSFVRQWQSFVGNVVAGAPPAVSGHDARVPLVAGLAAVESMATGRPVRL
ncbi:MAG TPA: Gfo/Idh/MocA family oxidoreductase [Desertimonas sp.]|nr:Gfo/Idh/MocA family oxidoreductase [Desertimonas sp.]